MKNTDPKKKLDTRLGPKEVYVTTEGIEIENAGPIPIKLRVHFPLGTK